MQREEPVKFCGVIHNEFEFFSLSEGKCMLFDIGLHF